MLVDVVEMRRRGERLQREVIVLLPRVRGYLRMDTKQSRMPAAHPRAELIAHLYAFGTGGEDDWALEPLRHARVAKVGWGSMLVVGEQRVYRPEPRFYDVYRQAWWVIPDGQHKPAQSSPAGTSRFS